MLKENSERLQPFEKMLSFVQKQYYDAESKLQSLHEKGKEKTVTYRQLTSTKLQYQNMLSLYKVYDLTD